MYPYYTVNFRKDCVNFSKARLLTRLIMLPKPYFLHVLDYIMWSNAEVFQNHHWWILAQDNTQIGGLLNEKLRSTGTVGTIGVLFCPRCFLSGPAIA